MYIPHPKCALTSRRKMAAIKLGSYLKELRILLCQTSKSSQGVRDFVEREYVNIKQHNPAFPVLIRECSMIEPKIYARYGECCYIRNSIAIGVIWLIVYAYRDRDTANGVERNISLNNLKSGEVLNCIERLASVKP